MKLKKLLQEEFINFIKVAYHDEPLPVYKNPSGDELKDIAKNYQHGSIGTGLKGAIKFIVDYNGQAVYAFPATLIHSRVWRDLGHREQIGASNLDNLNPAIFCGEGIYSEGKIKFADSDALQYQTKEYIKNMSKFHWEFANRFFTSPIKETIAHFSPKYKMGAGVKKNLDKKEINLYGNGADEVRFNRARSYYALDKK